MKTSRIPALLLALLLLVVIPRATRAQWHYPATHKSPVTDTYFGTPVVDNYRWLEGLDQTEVKDWLKAQADFTNSTLDRIPGRDSLLNDFVRLDAMRPANITTVRRKGGRYFYKKTLPAENVGRLFYREGLNGKEVLLFDPTAGASGKSVSLAFYEASRDGKNVILGTAEKG